MSIYPSCFKTKNTVSGDFSLKFDVKTHRNIKKQGKRKGNFTFSPYKEEINRYLICRNQFSVIGKDESKGCK